MSGKVFECVRCGSEVEAQGNRRNLKHCPDCDPVSKSKAHKYYRPSVPVLKARLSKAGITQAELARQVDVDRSTINRVLNEADYWPVDVPDFQGKVERYLHSRGVNIMGIWRRRGDAKYLEGVSMLYPEVKEKWGLAEDPFVDSVRAPEDVYQSKAHKKVLEQMLYAAKNQGFLAVIGEVGSGKTTVRMLMENILEKEGRVAVCKPLSMNKKRITAGTLMEALIRDLTTQPVKKSLEARARQLQRILQDLYVPEEKGVRSRTACLILEEGHDYSLQTLRELKRFKEITAGFKQLLSIIMIGQTELKHILDLSKTYEIREVILRVQKVYLQDMKGQATAYLEHKFHRVGGNGVLQQAFEPDAVKAIGKIAGNPLVINNMATAAMNEAYEKGYETVTRELIEAL